MLKDLKYKLLKLLAIVPLLLTMAPVMAQNGDVVYAGQTTVLSVEEHPGVTYTWELYNDVDGINLAQVPGNCPESEAYFVDGVDTGASVEVMWLSAGTYYYKVTADDGCSNNLKLGIIEIEESLPIAWFLEPDTVCIDDPAELIVELEGAGPWTIEYEVEYEGITTTYTTEITESPHVIEVIHSEEGEYNYTIISVTDTNGVTNDEPSGTVTLVVEPRPVTSPIERYDPFSKVE